MDRRKQLIDLLKDWGIAAAVTLLVFGVWNALRPDPPPAGGDAPQLVVPRVEGETYDLTAETADVVVVNFWATWCGPCRAEIPEFSAFAEANTDVRVLGVSVDDDMQPMQLSRAARQLGITYPVLHDRSASARAAWGVDVFPTTFVLDRHRHVVAVRAGQASRGWLEQTVAQARAGH